MKTLEKILTLFIGVGAVAGAVMMWIDPAGAAWGGEPLLEMLQAKMPWPNVFFKNFNVTLCHSILGGGPDCEMRIEVGR